MLTTVRQIDHVMVHCRDPERVMQAFVQELASPVAWPFSSYGSWASGGIALGNANLEFIAFEGHALAPDFEAAFFGLQLEPSPLSDVVPELERRGIPHGKPEPFPAAQSPMWTWVTLPGLSQGCHVSLCEYHAFPAAGISEPNLKMRATGGGRLGVTGLAEVEISVESLEAGGREWGALLDPNPRLSEDCWSLASDQTIRLTQGEWAGIHSMTLKVRSLAAARRELGDSATAVDGRRRVQVDRATLGGLEVYLVGGNKRKRYPKSALETSSVSSNRGVG